MVKKISMVICLVVTVVLIWVWHHQIQFNDLSRQALFHMRNGKFDEAIEAYTKAIRNKGRTIFRTRDASAYNNLGQAYLYKGEHAHAIAAFQKALSVKPNALEGRINLSTAYLKGGSPNQAIEICRSAIRTFPNAAFLYYNLACGLALQGQTESAIDSLRKSVALDGRMRGFAKTEQAFDGLRPHPVFSEE